MLRSRLVGYMGAKAAGRLGRLGVRSILRLQSGGGAGNFSRADVLKLRRHFSAPPSKGDKEPHERKEQDSGELDDVPFVSSIHELPDVENLGKRDENHVSGAAPGPDDARGTAPINLVARACESRTGCGCVCALRLLRHGLSTTHFLSEGGEKGGFGDPPWKTISVIGNFPTSLPPLLRCPLFLE